MAAVRMLPKSPNLICALHTAYLADKVKGWTISSKHRVHEQYGSHFTFLLFDRQLAVLILNFCFACCLLLCMFSACSVLQTFLMFKNVSYVSNVIRE